MNRCFFSRKDECKGKCKYCFGKWSTYLKFSNDETIEDNTIVYPNCDGDAFDSNWNDLTEKIKLLSGRNIIVSISTKFSISDEVLENLEELNRLLQKNGGMLKISVSFSCEQSICLFETGTATYSERIGMIQKVTERKIPYFTIIKPILPFIDFSEYQKIIDDTIMYCPYYVIGDLYIDMYTDFYKEYIENKDYLIQEKSVAWNGENGKWKVVVDDNLKDRIKKYITQSGGRVFESDKDAIIYIIYESKGAICDE
jgi:DNA repair photolyase